jgi:hypothetical protein
VDLKAVRAGEAPVRAHKRIDVSVLEQLEDGEAVESAEKFNVEQAIARYKTTILVMAAVSVFLLLVVVLLLFR